MLNSRNFRTTLELTLAVFVVIVSLGSKQAFALPITSISDIDLGMLTFTVTEWDEISSTDPEFATGANGESNGINYQLQAESIYVPFSSTGITANPVGQTYDSLPGSYDDLHLGRNFIISFDVPIESLLFALGNDNATGDGPDFGIAPVETDGINLSGTFLSIQDIDGALALFTFVNPISSIQHQNSNGILDGFDVSFFAFPAANVNAIPEPSILMLFLIGFASVCATRQFVLGNTVLRV